MTIKFTKCGVGSELNDETLLFEFLDHECPEFIEFEWSSSLVKNKFIGSLQTNQHNGIFLEPFSLDFTFFGSYVDKVGNRITAKERFDQLSRLQGRALKFWFEGIKQIVIIEKLKPRFYNYEHVTGTITLSPHDLQVTIAPEKVESFKQKSYIFSTTDVDTNTKETTDAKAKAGGDILSNKLKTEIEKDIKITNKRLEIAKLKTFNKNIQADIDRLNKKDKLNALIPTEENDLKNYKNTLQNNNAQIKKLEKEIGVRELEVYKMNETPTPTEINKNNFYKRNNL